MKLKIGKKTIIAIGLLVVAGGIYYFQNSEKKEEVPKNTVVIVAKDYIPENTLITKEMVKEDSRNTEDLMKQKGDLTSKVENVVGKRVITPIYKEEAVNLKRLIDNQPYMDEKDSEGKTLYVIAINSNDRALNIKKGSYIDVWLKPTENGILEGIEPSKLFDKYKVYDTRSEGYSETGKPPSGDAKDTNVTTYLTLYLTDAEIKQILETKDALVSTRVSLHGENMDYSIVKEKIENKPLVKTNDKKKETTENEDVINPIRNSETEKENENEQDN